MKNSKSKMNKMKPTIVEDMGIITADPRFSHVGSDPKLRYIPKKKSKVKVDERFSSLMTDARFHEKSTMDPRGRKGNFSTQEDLKRFYNMSSSDEEDDDDETVSSTSPNKAASNSTENVNYEDDFEEDSSDGEDESDTEKDKTSTLDENKKTVDKDESVPDDVKEQLQKYDFSRGVAFFTDSSDDDSTTTDEDEEPEDNEFEWGELDKDAIWDDDENEVEETSRIAVCNMNWDRVNSTDLMFVLSSSIPAGGRIKSVKIYISEFGKERLAKENEFGPQELVQMKEINEEELRDLEKLEKGDLRQNSVSKNKSRLEAVRRYQRNRLKYYYAVVECDSVGTAKNVYKECDRNTFEGSGTMIDLRYIPEDMTFDDEPTDVCEKLPKNYEVKTFTTSALQDSNPHITWDETNSERKKDISTVMSQIMKGKEPDYDRLQAYIASCSEEEEESDDEEAANKKKERTAKLRMLFDEIEEEENKRKEQQYLFSEVGDNETKKTEESSVQDDSDGYSSDFESDYDDESEDQGGESESHDDSENDSDSEVDESEKSSSKKKISNDLGLLLMDEEKEDRKHFSMRKIIEQSKNSQTKQKKNKFTKKKSKSKIEEEKAKKKEDNYFKVDVDSRFSCLVNSSDFHIDPSHPSFKKTDGMDQVIKHVQSKRFSQSTDDLPEAKRSCITKTTNDQELNVLIKKLKGKSKLKSK